MLEGVHQRSMGLEVGRGRLGLIVEGRSVGSQGLVSLLGEGIVRGLGFSGARRERRGCWC